MATELRSPNPHFSTVQFTKDALTIISKLEHGLEDVPWAEAVIVGNSTELSPNGVPKADGAMFGVCHGTRMTSGSLQLHCSIASKKGVIPAVLGIYANCTLDSSTDVVEFTGKTLVATCSAKDPCIFNNEPDGMKACPDKVFSFQIRVNVSDADVDTTSTMQDRTRDLEYNVESESADSQG